MFECPRDGTMREHSSDAQADHTNPRQALPAPTPHESARWVFAMPFQTRKLHVEFSPSMRKVRAPSARAMNGFDLGR